MTVTYDTASQNADFADLKLGQSASFSKTVTEADIILFSGVSGDVNPAHIDQNYAANSMFKGRIAHGMLSASFISAVLGTRLPGPGTIYLSQNLKFKAPVRPGDTVTARVTVKELNAERKQAVLTTQCFVGEVLVIDGEALVMIPAAKKADSAPDKKLAAE
ncbi:MAG: MaoC family dehydratase [Alphaproteobacteria bacterium]|nr:MaoC family dehydratase [Alphaproteobacteria bacterium]